MFPSDSSFLANSPIYLSISKVMRNWHFLQFYYLFLRTLVQFVLISDPLFPTTCSIFLSVTMPLTLQIYLIQNLVSHPASSHTEHLFPLLFLSPFLLKAQHISQTRNLELTGNLVCTQPVNMGFRFYI